MQPGISPDQLKRVTIVPILKNYGKKLVKSFRPSFIQSLHFHALEIHNQVGLLLLIRLQISLSHFNEHKFKHGF